MFNKPVEIVPREQKKKKKTEWNQVIKTKGEKAPQTCLKKGKKTAVRLAREAKIQWGLCLWRYLSTIKTQGGKDEFTKKMSDDYIDKRWQCWLTVLEECEKMKKIIKTSDCLSSSSCCSSHRASHHSKSQRDSRAPARLPVSIYLRGHTVKMCLTGLGDSLAVQQSRSDTHFTSLTGLAGLAESFASQRSRSDTRFRTLLF